MRSCCQAGGVDALASASGRTQHSTGCCIRLRPARGAVEARGAGQGARAERVWPAECVCPSVPPLWKRRTQRAASSVDAKQKQRVLYSVSVILLLLGFIHLNLDLDLDLDLGSLQLLACQGSLTSTARRRCAEDLVLLEQTTVGSSFGLLRCFRCLPPFCIGHLFPLLPPLPRESASSYIGQSSLLLF